MTEQDWRPSASFQVLRKRATLISQVRHFFQKRNYLEVETPIMAHYGITDVYLSNIKAHFRGEPYCLQTSPEYHMKRLLAAGSGPIFQLARVFRDDELGRWHNPEFTMLEWYQLDIDHHVLMNEVDELLQEILQVPPMLKMTYREAFLQICNLDPFCASIAELKASLQSYHLENVLDPYEEDRDQYLFLLMSHVVEMALAKEKAPVALYNFPPSQSALAKVNQGYAERFEVYYKGIELANGFHELTDAKAQAERFNVDIALRAAKNLELPKVDNYLLNALEQGLPACSGVALGLDRLITLALGLSRISETLAFDFSRA
ncbi:elongation factor P--(R)-beta-lysine ligase [Legionella jordanis]|uniref:Lysyl-tRNA synthetase n=1 Tax=Legionella jordanis TaxID=456 RepID=A0A0W0V942_9GAMM|nr:elongation factor P--(R)-beta-lysine ligase [Legionella jordanis]KTD16600.1 lysyl-tRNA synthetase [Legionella jordanis]RMX03861.1 elongation factor P--(R)-beta-lysine ligase [Legionella jordanis]RMX22077.1 elongation factor P--(R)-beta-lysine ligase [Legionella jordanis]VEH11936.1 lysyl-tRNA synthetase [Legionella jordanis]HAT8712760.1 elongation factor P--(R)-beta-lysine ligase [Legionella jordanis]